MKFYPYEKGGGRKSFSHAEGGGGTKGFEAVTKELEVLAILNGGGAHKVSTF